MSIKIVIVDDETPIRRILARVRANVRDHLKTDMPVILDDRRIHINLSKRWVALLGQKVELTPKEYAVLSRFTQRLA